MPGLVRRGLAGALRARERAVILPAVQSLRRAGSEGLWGEGRERSLACPGLLGEVSGGMRLLQSGAGRGFCVGWGGAAEFDAFFDVSADGVLDVFGGDAEGVFHGEWA